MEAGQTRELCEEVFRGACMGMDSIDEMIRRSDKADFRQELTATRNAYQMIAQEARQAIESYGGTPQELPVMMRMSNSLRVNAATLFNKSEERLSEMVLKGMDMADQEVHIWLDKFVNADEQAKALARELLELQRTERAVYRKYLN